MYQVDDEPTTAEPIETIHVYVVREGDKKPSLVPLVLPVLVSLFIFFSVVALPVCILAQQTQEPTIIRVPTIFLPLKTFMTSVSVVPTGIKTYPATTAHGILTITNGSIVSEELPKGMIFTGTNGVEVVTDTAVFVPPGSATGLGYATVPAHAAIPGVQGNIPILAIDQVEGTALFIRNVQPFSGGANSYSVKVITSEDRETAFTQARAILLPQTLAGLLASPCKETVTESHIIHVRWTCQYVTYQAPQGKVLSVKVQGKVILLEIEPVARPRILTTK